MRARRIAVLDAASLYGVGLILPPRPQEKPPVTKQEHVCTCCIVHCMHNGYQSGL
jgi:hypothetical protein